MAFSYDPTTGRAKVTVYAGRDASGAQRQRSRSWTATSARAARATAIDVERSLRDSVTTRHAHGATVRQLVGQWCAHRHPLDSPSTIRGRQPMLHRVVERFGDTPLHALRAHQIDAWYAELHERGLAPVTIRKGAHGLLRAIIRQGVRWGMCDDTAIAQATPPGGHPAPREIPPTATVRALLDTAPADIRMAVHVLAATGMRRGELLGLRWGDVDPIEATIAIRRRAVIRPDGIVEVRAGTKTGPTRTVPIDADTAAMLAGARPPDGRGDGDRWVITRRSPNHLSSAWSRHVRAHGVRMRLHDLRHWHASVLIDAGLSPVAVAKRLGHASPSMTLNVYSHAFDRSDRTATDAVARELHG